MTQTTKPSKESVRDYMDRRTHTPQEPPPAAEEIRRRLGWRLLPEQHPADQPDRD